MKLENIVLFKRFLKTEGSNVLFAGMYKQFHPKDATDNVEEFLLKVDAKDAILGAFHFPENSNFGVDYWFQKAVKWEKLLSSATTSQFYAWCWHNKEKVEKEAKKPLPLVSAYLHPFGGEGDAITRALSTPEHSSSSPEMEEYIKGLQEGNEQKEDVAKAVESKKLNAWTGKDFKKEEPKPEQAPTLPKGVTEEQMALSGFSIFKIKKVEKYKLKEGFISINTKSGHRACFNQWVSNEIKEAGHPYLHVFSKEENTLYFLFDNIAKDGVAWRVNSKNVVFSHKQLVTNIVAFFGIKEEIAELSISNNMAKTKNNLFYKITKKK